MENKVEIIKVTMLSILVCCKKDVKAEEVVKLTNVENLYGTTSGWCLPSEESFREHIADNNKPNIKNGEITCTNDENKRHWILDA